jgi:hypothetical protein
MNTFSRVAIALVGMTGLVAAQPRTDPRAGGDVKAADAKAGAMPETKPPAELAAMVKMTTGTWTCKGQGMDQTTKKMVDMIGTMKMKLDVSGWWMHASFESKIGKSPFQFESFTTFDPASKKWKRVMVESGGGWSSGESAGMQGNKVEWELTSHGLMGDAMFRDHEDLSDPKAGAKMWGEFSIDQGKSWTKVYEMTCKK